MSEYVCLYCKYCISLYYIVFSDTDTDTDTDNYSFLNTVHCTL